MRGREINHQEGVRGREKEFHLVKNSWSSGVLLEELLLHLLPQIQSVKSLFLPKIQLHGLRHLNTTAKNYRTTIVSAYDLFGSVVHNLDSARSKRHSQYSSFQYNILFVRVERCNNNLASGEWNLIREQFHCNGRVRSRHCNVRYNFSKGFVSTGIFFFSAWYNLVRAYLLYASINLKYFRHCCHRLNLCRPFSKGRQWRFIIRQWLYFIR